MKEKNFLCPECRVCSYCLQRGSYPCNHPVEPIYGHCMHHNDLRPVECGICVDNVLKACRETRIKKLEEELAAEKAEVARLRLCLAQEKP